MAVNDERCATSGSHFSAWDDAVVHQRNGKLDLAKESLRRAWDNGDWRGPWGLGLLEEASGRSSAGAYERAAQLYLSARAITDSPEPSRALGRLCCAGVGGIGGVDEAIEYLESAEPEEFPESALLLALALARRSGKGRNDELRIRELLGKARDAGYPRAYREIALEAIRRGDVLNFIQYMWQGINLLLSIRRKNPKDSRLVGFRM
jgi:TPR repeat protein